MTVCCVSQSRRISPMDLRESPYRKKEARPQQDQRVFDTERIARAYELKGAALDAFLHQSDCFFARQHQQPRACGTRTSRRADNGWRTAALLWRRNVQEGIHRNRLQKQQGCPLGETTSSPGVTGAAIMLHMSTGELSPMNFDKLCMEHYTIRRSPVSADCHL